MPCPASLPYVQRKGKILNEAAGTAGLNRDHLAHVPASCNKLPG
jgi:hypothetical protein